MVAKSEPVPFRPLGHILNVVESFDLDVTYIYEDLVFIEHNAFMFRMGDKGEDVFLYFNTESTESERDSLAEQIISTGKKFDLNIVWTGLFTISQKENERAEIKFFENETINK